MLIPGSLRTEDSPSKRQQGDPASEVTLPQHACL